MQRYNILYMLHITCLLIYSSFLRSNKHYTKKKCLHQKNRKRMTRNIFRDLVEINYTRIVGRRYTLPR